MPKLFTYKEVADHNTQNDIWMIINDKVYDCSKFVDEHPGGEEILFDLAGQDATGAFIDIGHSDDATNMLESLYVGDLDKNSEPINKKTPETIAATTGGEGNGIMIIAIIISFLGILYYYMNM